MSRITSLPEFGIVVFSFLLHFVWEMLQVPFYADVDLMPHWQGVKMCTQATVGDVGFALTAFWLTSLAARSRYWFFRPSGLQMTLYIAVGIALTAAGDLVRPAADRSRTMMMDGRGMWFGGWGMILLAVLRSRPTVKKCLRPGWRRR